MRSPLVQAPSLLTRVQVTPIIDVALVLVIILLITAPILSVADLDVDVPQAHTRGAEDEARVIVTVGRSGEIAVGEEVIDEQRFESHLRSQLQESQDLLVVIRADRGVRYARVESLLQRARDAGAQRLAVATRQKGSGGR